MPPQNNSKNHGLSLEKPPKTSISPISIAPMMDWTDL